MLNGEIITANRRREGSRPAPFRWWHAALFWLLVNLPGLVIGWRDELFPGFRSPPLRPPGFLFPIIWFFITVCTLGAGLRILNNRTMKRRRLHIGLQALFWLDFLVFPYFFFALSSPILGGLLTQTIFLLALAEVAMLWCDDRTDSYLMMPLLVWGAFAGLYAATWQALYNPDPFLGWPALLG
jgi:tryptophan-rich sensory protein